MDATGNFFIMLISIFMYFFLIGLVYIKVVNPQYPLNWALVMKFMLGINHYDDMNTSDGFTTVREGLSDKTRPIPSSSIIDGVGSAIAAAGTSTTHRFSKNINWLVDWMSVQTNRLLVKLYIDKNTFYSTQRINYRPIISL